MLTFLICLFVIVVSVLNTLLIKSELERLFREKKGVFIFHICNVLFILMVAFAAYAVVTRYVLGRELDWVFQMVILLFTILPIYILGHFAFEKYKLVNRKYSTAENGKVLIISEKYLKKKRRPNRFRKYNEF
ncbi:hypothetical protein GCM10008967_39970 [Bacillus carboniphilus]|uniref:Uncharacterized protein n=1 Tax=Bacillus carboniphilus TaxID=86663 RepID=A0ABN0WSN1_9BACI